MRTCCWPRSWGRKSTRIFAMRRVELSQESAFSPDALSAFPRSAAGLAACSNPIGLSVQTGIGKSLSTTTPVTADRPSPLRGCGVGKGAPTATSTVWPKPYASGITKSSVARHLPTNHRKCGPAGPHQTSAPGHDYHPGGSQLRGGDGARACLPAVGHQLYLLGRKRSYLRQVRSGYPGRLTAPKPRHSRRALQRHGFPPQASLRGVL